MKFQLDDYHRNVSDKALLDELKRVADQLGKRTVNRVEFDDLGKYGTTTYLRRFGSWFKALELAGLEKTRTPMNVPDAELFKNLEDVWTKLGRQPRYAQVRAPLSKYHVGTYENRFGTWRKALQKFVDYVDSEAVSQVATNDFRIKSRRNASHKTKRGVSDRLRFLVFRRDHFKCRICGKSPATYPGLELHVGHILAWVKGGESTINNLQTLCSQCNIGKSDLSHDA